MCINVRNKAVAAPQQDDWVAIQMKDEQQLHGASPKPSLTYVAGKSDSQMEEDGSDGAKIMNERTGEYWCEAWYRSANEKIILKIEKEVCKSYSDVRFSVKWMHSTS